MIGKITQPEEETTTETPTTEDSIESQPAVDEVAETSTGTETTEVKADQEVIPNIHNCPVCKGSGLQDDRHLCPACLGTGRILS